MLGKPRILSLLPTRLINSIKHEHSCKILYIKRQLTFVHSADSDNEETVTVASLPVSQKPLRKGYNFSSPAMLVRSNATKLRI